MWHSINGSLIGQKVRVCPHIFYYMTLMALSLADLKRKCGGGVVELLCWRKWEIVWKRIYCTWILLTSAGFVHLHFIRALFHYGKGCLPLFDSNKLLIKNFFSFWLIMFLFGVLDGTAKGVSGYFFVNIFFCLVFCFFSFWFVAF